MKKHTVTCTVVIPLGGEYDTKVCLKLTKDIDPPDTRVQIGMAARGLVKDRFGIDLPYLRFPDLGGSYGKDDNRYDYEVVLTPEEVTYPIAMLASVLVEKCIEDSKAEALYLGHLD